MRLSTWPRYVSSAPAGNASGTADVVDAIVIVTAVRHQAPVVTSDPGDLTRIAGSLGVKICLFPT